MEELGPFLFGVNVGVANLLPSIMNFNSFEVNFP